MNKTLLPLLACPKCKGLLKYNKKNNILVCKADRLAYPVINGIPMLLDLDAIVLDRGNDLSARVKIVD